MIKKILFTIFLIAFNAAANAEIRVPAGANIQSYWNVAAGQKLIISGGSYTTTGLNCVSNVEIVSDGKVTITSATAAPIINFSGCSNFSLRGDFELVGNGSSYTVHPSTQVLDGAQAGIYLNGSDNYDIDGNIVIRNIKGTGLKAEQTAGGWKHNGKVRGVTVKDSYRGFWLTNRAEYMTLTDINASDNVFGIQVDSGNDTFVNAKTVFNSIGVKVCGSINSYCNGANHAHGVFVGLESNHNYYNLVIVDVATGQTFSGSHFIAGQSGSNAGIIQIINSKGLIISGGQIGSTFTTIDATSTILIQGNYMRPGLTGSIPVNPGGVLISKDNFSETGLWVGNN